MANRSYSGKGVPYLRNITDGGALLDMGNVTNLEFQLSATDITLANSRTGGGGNYNSFSRTDSVQVTITLTDYSKENMALAVFGSTTSVTASAVTDESIDAPTSLVGDPLVITANVIDTGETVTVTSDPAGTTYTAGTDYTVTSSGIIILADGNISGDDPLLITYTKKAVDVVQALTDSGNEYEMVFVGLNEGQSNAPVHVKIHKLKFSPAASLPMINDEFAELVLTGECLADTTYNGTSTSQYFEVKAA